MWWPQKIGNKAVSGTAALYFVNDLDDCTRENYCFIVSLLLEWVSKVDLSFVRRVAWSSDFGVMVDQVLLRTPPPFFLINEREKNWAVEMELEDWNMDDYECHWKKYMKKVILKGYLIYAILLIFILR